MLLAELLGVMSLNQRLWKCLIVVDKSWKRSDGAAPLRSGFVPSPATKVEERGSQHHSDTDLGFLAKMDPSGGMWGQHTRLCGSQGAAQLTAQSLCRALQAAGARLEALQSRWGCAQKVNVSADPFWGAL